MIKKDVYLMAKSSHQKIIIKKWNNKVWALLDLRELNSATVKKPKLQETSTLKLFNCFLKNTFNNKICEDSLKKEIIPILNRRLVLPLYIPVLALISSLMLIRSKRGLYNKYSIFLFNFLILLFTELVVRYTGINYFAKIFFIILN